MISGLSIAGDVFWILALAIMCSMSWAAHKRVPKDLAVPVAFRDEEVLVRAPKLAALWLIPLLAFAVGAWLKVESRTPDISVNSAWIWLGVRVTVAPLFAVLHLTQVSRGLQALGREGRL